MKDTMQTLLDEVNEKLRNIEWQTFFLLEKTNHDPRGLELTNGKSQYVAILEEPGQPDSVRLLRYDTRGFSGHSVYADPSLALEEALRDGYRHEAPGALENLSNTPAWKHGTAMLEIFHQLNDGRLTIEEAQSKRAALDQLYNLGETGATQ